MVTESVNSGTIALTELSWGKYILTAWSNELDLLISNQGCKVWGLIEWMEKELVSSRIPYTLEITTNTEHRDRACNCNSLAVYAETFYFQPLLNNTL